MDSPNISTSKTADNQLMNRNSDEDDVPKSSSLPLAQDCNIVCLNYSGQKEFIEGAIKALRTRHKPIGQVLKGVVVYVEVYVGGENQSDYVKDLLSDLGATINKRLNCNTTHVVFKKGRLGVYRRAKAMNMAIVSPRWVESCRSHRRVCDARKYPIREKIMYDFPGLYRYYFRLLHRKFYGARIYRYSCSFSHPNNVVPRCEALNRRLRQAGMVFHARRELPTCSPSNAVTAQKIEAQAANFYNFIKNYGKGNDAENQVDSTVDSAAQGMSTANSDASDCAATPKAEEIVKIENVGPEAAEAKQVEPKSEDKAESQEASKQDMDHNKQTGKVNAAEDDSKITCEASSTSPNDVADDDKPKGAKARVAKLFTPMINCTKKYMQRATKGFSLNLPKILRVSSKPAAVSPRGTRRHTFAPILRSLLESKKATSPADAAKEVTSTEPLLGISIGAEKVKKWPKKSGTLRKFTKMPTIEECKDNADAGEPEKKEMFGDFVNGSSDIPSETDVE